MSDHSASASSHAAWLRGILAEHRDTVGDTTSPAYIMVCTAMGPLIWGQLVRAAGSATQIEEGDYVEPCSDWTMPHGICTTDADSEQTVTVIVGLWSENGPIRSSSEVGPQVEGTGHD